MATTIESPVFDEKSCFKGLKHIIGNTPILEIHFRYKKENRVIYAKAEYVNMTGSIKDRMAYHILKNVMRRRSGKGYRSTSGIPAFRLPRSARATAKERVTSSEPVRQPIQ